MPSPSFRRRTLLTGAAASAVAGVSGAFGRAAAAAPSSYTATWNSIDQHPPAPEWFQDAKFGIYFHWGVFSVPAYDYEWYPRNMYIAGHKANQHHIATYGDPSSWPFHNFINGARDKAGTFVQFAPKLVSAGGKFDPNEWAQLFVDAGARWAGPVAEHHDGFSMWNSRVNEWNSVAKGPKLDLLTLFTNAIRAKNLKLLVSMHHAYNINGYFDHAPHQSDPSLQKLYGQLSHAAENQLWFDKLKEIIDQAQPDIIYQDFTLDKIDEAQRLNFAAYYYNRANAWGREVVATYKDGYNNRGELYDFERGGPADILSPYWLTDDSISSSSWSYTVGMKYNSAAALTHALIDRVSKNGNMMLNISPMADGSIPQAQRDILHQIGDHLKRYGESVYSTRAWSIYGEGPTTMGGAIFQTPPVGTAKDIRFSRNKANTVLYASVLGWPGNGATLTISTLASDRINLGTLTRVELLGATAGTYIPITGRSQDVSGLHLILPSRPAAAIAYIVKLTFTGQIPAIDANPAVVNGGIYHIDNVASGLALDSGGNVNAGDGLKQWAYDGSTNLQWQVVDSGGGYHRLVNRTNGMVADGWGNTSPSQVLQAPWNGNNNQMWTITPLGGGRYRVINRTTGLALDGGGAVPSGSPAKQYPVTDSPNLEWRFIRIA